MYNQRSTYVEYIFFSYADRNVYQMFLMIFYYFFLPIGMGLQRVSRNELNGNILIYALLSNKDIHYYRILPFCMYSSYTMYRRNTV